jgi:hypothetical protein
VKAAVKAKVAVANDRQSTPGNEMKTPTDDNRAIVAALDAIAAEDSRKARAAITEFRQLLTQGTFTPTITTSPTPAPTGSRMATVAYLADGFGHLALAKKSGNKEMADEIIAKMVRAVGTAVARGIPGFVVET